MGGVIDGETAALAPGARLGMSTIASSAPVEAATVGSGLVETNTPTRYGPELTAPRLRIVSGIATGLPRGVLTGAVTVLTTRSGWTTTMLTWAAAARPLLVSSSSVATPR